MVLVSSSAPQEAFNTPQVAMILPMLREQNWIDLLIELLKRSNWPDQQRPTSPVWRFSFSCNTATLRAAVPITAPIPN